MSKRSHERPSIKRRSIPDGYGARAYEVDETTGAICDTQKQIERYAGLGSTPQAATIINEGTHACELVSVRYIKGSEVNRLYVADKLFQVVEILIVQANMHGEWAAITPAIQYALLPVEER
jgi:hypothetical protein